MKISKNQIKRVVKDMRRALSLLELELEVRDRQALSKRATNSNMVRRAEVVRLVERLGHPVTARVVRMELIKTGKTPSVNTIAVKLNEAAAKGELTRRVRGLYEAAPLANGAAESMQ